MIKKQRNPETPASALRLAKNRWDILFPLLLAGLSVLLWLPRLGGPIDLRYDAGVYYISGTALAEGKGYRILSEPGEIHAIQYPPLLPAVAAAFQRVLGREDLVAVGRALRLFFLLLFTLYIVAIYFVGRRYLPAAYAFFVSLLPLLSVLTLFMADLLFAEIPFACVTMLFLLSKDRPNARLGAVLPPLLAVAAYLLRTVGIVMLGTWIVEAVIRRELRTAGCRLALALIPIIGWQAYILSVKKGPEYARPAYAYQRADYQFYNVGYIENIAYIDPFAPDLGKSTLRNWAGRVLRNGLSMPYALAETVSAERPTWEGQRQRWNAWSTRLRWPEGAVDTILFLLSGLITAGGVILLWRREWFILIYALVYIVMMCLTPRSWSGQFSRYMVPLAPLIALGLMQSLTTVTEFFERRFGKTGRGIGIALAALIISVCVLQETLETWMMYRDSHAEVIYYDRQGGRHTYRLFYYDQAWQELDASIEWLKAHTQSTDVIATATPHWLYLKTGLKAVMPPYEQDAEKAQMLLDNVPVRYLIVDNLGFLDVSRRYSQPVVQAHPEAWVLAYAASEDGLRIYRRVGP